MWKRHPPGPCRRADETRRALRVAQAGAPGPRRGGTAEGGPHDKASPGGRAPGNNRPANGAVASPEKRGILHKSAWKSIAGRATGRTASPPSRRIASAFVRASSETSCWRETACLGFALEYEIVPTIRGSESTTMNPKVKLVHRTDEQDPTRDRRPAK
jgi:hypothetical protein